MVLAIWLINALKKLIVNPIFLIVMLSVLSFSAGWIYKGKSIDKAQVKSDLEQVTQTIVKYEKIHKKYASIKLDTIANIECLLSYSSCENSSSNATSLPQGKSK